MRDFLQRLFAALGIEASPEVTEDEAIDLIKQKQAQVINDAVDDAILQGKLFPDERGWAVELGMDNGMEVFSAFLEHRKPLPKLLMRTAGTHAPGRVEIDELQAKTNRQFGISDEQFLKYNAAPESTGDEIQDRMNRQCGVTPELWAKANARLDK